MIDRALVGPGPGLQERLAAYRAVIGDDGVQRFTELPAEVTATTVIDVEDPHTLPAESLSRVAHQGGLVLAGAPLQAPPAGLRFTLAVPDLVAGPLAAMHARAGNLGVRTMTKAVIRLGDAALAVALFRACLAAAALGGPIDRLASRQRGATVWAVGRLRDGSVVYLEAGVNVPPAMAIEQVQALGRDRTLEYDSRDRRNRVHGVDGWRPLPAQREAPYRTMLRRLAEREQWLGLPEWADVVSQAQAAFRGVLAAAERPAAVSV